MTRAEVLERLKELGVRVEVEGDKLFLVPGSLVPLDLVEALRQHKPQVMALLKAQGKAPEPQPASDPSRCRNTLTSHSVHEFPWECDPYSCYCYQEFGYPRLCQGVPCRWVWPKGVPGAADNG